MNDRFLIKNLDELQGEEKEGYDYKFKQYEVTKNNDKVQAMFYELLPNNTIGVRRNNFMNTECLYVIEGEGIIEVNGEKLKIKEKDVVIFPKVELDYEVKNTSIDKKLLYIYLELVNPNDILNYINTNEVIKENTLNSLYRENNNLNYYDEEK